MELTFFDRLKKICPDSSRNEPMRCHTTFRIGGDADYFAVPEDSGQLKEIITLCKKEKIPYLILGNGSNMLVSDRGIEGVVINITSKLSKADISGRVITCGAGVLLSRLSRLALDAGLSGLERAAGIPGTLGGAIYMNAGAYGFEMKDIIKNVTYIDENADLKTAQLSELCFGYRTSMFTGRQCAIVSAEAEFSSKDKKLIEKEMAEYTEQRVSKQPLNMPSAGSVFKRPEGHFAGGLIEQAGLKGYSVGDAAVSEKHAGFIVNKGNATAAEVMELIEHIQKTVEDKFCVKLEPEIKLIGRK